MPTLAKPQSPGRQAIDAALKQHNKVAPLWLGPCGVTGPDEYSGVTQSLLGRSLVCPERFRLGVMEGFREPDKFNHRTAYGDMFHVMAEHNAAGKDMGYCVRAVLEHCKGLAVKHKDQQQDISKWYNIVTRQFQSYVNHWSKNKENKKRKNVFSEQVFDVPYKLPSGRTVRLRGKWDSVDLIDKGLYIEENKTKGEVIKEKITRQLKFDLQAMFYIVALQELLKNPYGYSQLQLLNAKATVQGINYNVVRRPLAEGKYCIRQHKGRGKDLKGAETTEQYYNRLGKLIESDPEWFFVRFKVDISQRDVDKFKALCLHPVLENLCDDYEWWWYCFNSKTGPHSVYEYDVREKWFPYHKRRHHVMPYGIYSYLLDGGETHLDNYLLTGDDRGLERTTEMFRELK